MRTEPDHPAAVAASAIRPESAVGPADPARRRVSVAVYSPSMTRKQPE